MKNKLNLMSCLRKILVFTYNPKYKIFFFLSPFLVMVFGIIGVFVMIKMGFTNPKFMAPIFIAIVYFLFWQIIMYIRSHYTVGVMEGLEKRKFIKLSEVFEIYKQEAGKYNWVVKDKISLPFTNLGFNIKGSEGGIPFEIEIVPSFPGKYSGPLSSSSIYMLTNKGEGFEMSWKDDFFIAKNTLPKEIKLKLFNLEKINLQWLIKERQFITTISFSNGSMGALISSNYNGLDLEIKEVLSRLAQVVKSYNQLSS